MSYPGEKTKTSRAPVTSVADDLSDPGIRVLMGASTQGLFLPLVLIPDLCLRPGLRGVRSILRWLGIVPGSLLKPALESPSGPITHVSQLFTPALGALQKVLTHTPPLQRQVIQAVQLAEDTTGLLISNPVRQQTPA